MRFNTDKALFDAFPVARDHIKTEASGAPPAAFMKTLCDRGKLDEALSFCAHLLPRREAVIWACQCLRAKNRDDHGAEVPFGPAFDAAEAWGRAPSEERRRAAYACWSTADRSDPAAWFALGAAWSGGSLTPDGSPSMPAAPHLTATMIRVGLIMLLHGTAAARKAAAARDWLAAGVRLAETGA